MRKPPGGIISAFFPEFFFYIPPGGLRKRRMRVTLGFDFKGKTETAMGIGMIAGHEQTPGRKGNDRLHEKSTEPSVPHVLLDQCASLNIKEKGPMVSNGVSENNP